MNADASTGSDTFTGGAGGAKSLGANVNSKSSNWACPSSPAYRRTYFIGPIIAPGRDPHVGRFRDRSQRARFTGLNASARYPQLRKLIKSVRYAHGWQGLQRPSSKSPRDNRRDDVAERRRMIRP